MSHDLRNKGHCLRSFIYNISQYKEGRQASFICRIHLFVWLDRNYCEEIFSFSVFFKKNVSVRKVGMYDSGSHRNFASHPAE